MHSLIVSEQKKITGLLRHAAGVAGGLNNPAYKQEQRHVNINYPADAKFLPGGVSDVYYPCRETKASELYFCLGLKLCSLALGANKEPTV